MKDKKISNYNHLKIEPKWQKFWDKEGINKTPEKSKKEKFYILDMFPYPSGQGLHVGHPRGFVATDIYSRFMKMRGFNVLHPMGWDAFGLPAENYAIKMKTNPVKMGKLNIARYKKQISILGLNYDWSREINTTDPAYYKWTQWAFLQMYKKGLVFESNEPINWCPSCKTGLANEDLDGSKCERCGSEIEKKPLRQWVIKITDYADRLIKDLDLLPDWPENVKEAQKNWIGKSEGSELWFNIKNSEEKIRVFTTRPDTLFGVTYLVLSPEGSLVQSLKPLIKNWSAVEKYIKELKNKTEIERTATDKPKTGIKLEGVEAKHPLTKEILPVWIADYVLANYGTGAVMAVPAHDERDFAFAKKYDLPIKQVIVEVKKDYTPLCTIRRDKKTVERRSVVCIIKHWSEDKYLCLNWKKANWHTPITGGIDEGETPEEAGIREIIEESGFKNFKLLGRGLDIIGEYYHPIKDINRFERQTPLFFQLLNSEQLEISEEEKENHELVWISKNEVENYLNHDEKNFDARVALHVWSQYLKPNAVTGNGILINSGEFDGMDNEEAKKKITDLADGVEKVTFKLKDWVFSRQRYWGEPIPLIHCDKCGIVPVPEKDLPLELPKVKFYEPTGTGESPLAGIDKWVNTKCPKCGGKAKRETNTMPQWAGSSWYYLRYIDPNNKKALIDPKKEKYWMREGGVDLYVGGGEHNTRHLIYARFWHKFLYDIGVVSQKEPFSKLRNLGMILGADGRKMSKRWGNVVNPDDVVKNVGADTLRVYESFMGPFDQEIAWSTDNMVGSRRFLDRVWRLAQNFLTERSSKVSRGETFFPTQGLTSENQDFEMLLHQTIKKVTEDILNFNFNTAISAFMILLNQAETRPNGCSSGRELNISKKDYEIIIKLLSPFAPYITEEIWSKLGHSKSIHLEKWPEYDKNKIVSDKIIIVVQINGKPRASFDITIDATQEQIEKEAFGREEVAKWLVGKKILKKFFIKGKILSLVTD
jgi:leucyl-tRNA synthetase